MYRLLAPNNILAMSKTVIGVMGPAEGATSQNIKDAYELGQLITQAGWVTLSGGRNSGVMDALSREAQEAGGFVIGILPTKDRKTYSKAIDIAIVTDMGSARNNINVLSSSVVVACGMGIGTASEIALALKSNMPVVLLNSGESGSKFFTELSPDRVFIASSPDQAIKLVKTIV